jgi:hypothetical protein
MDKMKRQSLWFGLSLAAALCLLVGPVLSDDSKPAKKPKQQDPLAAMIKQGTPGPNHKHLNALVGTWKAKSKFWMDPTKKPEESEGECVRKWILGGRFLHEEYKGKAMNQPFRGIGLVGYDNLKKKFTSIWVDSMSTSIWGSEGTYDSAKKTFTFVSEAPDPFTGKKSKSRDVIKIVSDNETLVQMFREGPKGKDIKILEIVYTRK